MTKPKDLKGSTPSSLVKTARKVSGSIARALKQMIQRFTENLDRQDIYANGKELARVMGRDKDSQGRRVHEWPEEMEQYVASFENPVLVSDNRKINTFNSILSYTLSKLLDSRLKITEYDGISIRFDENKYEGLWGPSIDTLLFCRALGKTDISGVKEAIEIGSGSGFISKYLLKNAENLEQMFMVDIDSYAKICADDNINDSRVEFHVGDGLKFVEGKKFDRVLCNPPYIRRPASIDDNPYEGIGLLINLIAKAPEMLKPRGKLITNISSLSGEAPYQMIEEKKLEARIVDEMTVPLKVMNVLNEEKWLNYLLKNGLKKEPKDGHDYWHTIKIYEIGLKK